MEENLMLIIKILIIVVVLLNSMMMRLQTGNNSTIIIGVFVSMIIAKPMEFYNILSSSAATISEFFISNFWYILWTTLGIIAFILVLNLIKRKNKCK